MNIEKHIDGYPVDFMSGSSTTYYSRTSVRKMIEDIFQHMPTGLHDSFGKEIRNNDIVMYESMIKKYRAYVFYANGAFRVQYSDGDEDFLQDVHHKCEIQ